MRAHRKHWRCCAAVGSVLLLALRARATGVPFRESVRFSLGAAPVAIAAGQRDGYLGLDVVVVSADSSMSTLFGDGKGGFGKWVRDVSFGTDVVGLALGDVDGDGHLDAVVSAPSAGTVFTYLGRIDGNFDVGPSLHSSWSPGVLALSDQDGDRKLDLVVADLFFQGLVVAKGDGQAGFTFTGQAPGFADPVAIALGDMNGDGVPDVAVADQVSRQATVVRGAASGAFGARFDIPLAGRPVSVALGDLDGDGHPDAVFAMQGPGGFTVLLGAADGTLRPLYEYATGSDPAAIAIADFDGDLIPDLAVADRTTDSITVWHGVGDGSFTPIGSVATGAGPVALVVADMDGDSHADLVCANGEDHSVSVFLNTDRSTPHGGFVVGSPVPNPTTAGCAIPLALAVPTTVQCEIHDLNGRLVRRLANAGFGAGFHRITWDGVTDHGDLARSGLYFARIRIAGLEDMRRIVLAR